MRPTHSSNGIGTTDEELVGDNSQVAGTIFLARCESCPKEDAGIGVTIREAADRGQAITRLRALSRQGGTTGGADVERFTVANTDGVLRLTPTPAAINSSVDQAVGQTIDVLGSRIRVCN